MFGGRQNAQEKYPLSSWVPGTFFLPNTGPPCFLKHFLSSGSCNTSFPLQNVEIKVFTLDDGTQVKQRIVKSKNLDKPNNIKCGSLARKDKKGKKTAKDYGNFEVWMNAIIPNGSAYLISFNLSNVSNNITRFHLLRE
ncbi:hypothetical protein [Parasitella parasitica]|uniref:Uncharacterized protein n=1 Tax=Parasitella parasitica TaxID=35722 RepID=A0A0B7MSR8_9FUNG|nr:hypothetical protein [Parasitella parasitica]